jgi:hypothetical protein
MRLVPVRPSCQSSALWLSLLGMAAATVISSAAFGASQAPPSAPTPKIYHKGRNFRIPFKLNADGRDRIKEVHLLVSEDQGYHWRPVSRTFPDHPTFTFRSARDGEYWFAVQTVTNDGKVTARPDATVEPNLKVVVDTVPPSLLLEQDERRGSTVSVRWEVKDENLDLKTLVVEYQAEGASVWRRVPVRRPRLIGAQQWDAGTAEPLKVRASVADKAGNVTETAIDLPEGTASQPSLVSGDAAEASRPSVERISGGAGSEIVAGADFPPVEEALDPRRDSPSGRGPGQREQSNERSARDAQAAGAGRLRGRSQVAARATATAVTQSGPMDLFGGSGSTATSVSPETLRAGASAGGSSSPPSPGSGRDAAGSTLLVPNPKFKLQYAVDDAGPNGPASVELWMTQDGGRTWIRRGEDSDRVSPIEVDLGGEGTYGLYLVARSATGLGDQPPAPGDSPQTWVEVDCTAPLVQLYPPQVGTGVNSGKVAIAWRSSDLHLAPKSVSIFWRPEQPGTDWQLIAEGQDNLGQFIWAVPATVPPRFHLRVEAVDTVGHRGGADTTDTGALMVDRSRPRSRIIGLDPNARAGFGASARSMR